MAEQLQQFQGRLVGMQQQALGSTLTVGAAIGATVLTVAETGDFNEDGGFLVTPAGAVYEYVAVDDTASTVTLAGAGLTVALAAEDAVHLYDDELESEVVEYVGQVLLDDQDPGDEPIEVTVQHSLVNLIAETIRGGAAEAVTLVRDGDDDLMIWQVDGKVVSDVALAEVKTDLSVDIQAAYDLADSKATEAYVNATATTISQTAANGKSKVTYSATTPGTTANIAGDIWFQKDVPTQTIIGQWQGLGGNSWQQVALNDAVIANLDAGKLVAGSAFINGLWIKTNFTLGDASTNGVIQSYNFASSPVGVFIDKTGLVAKGGSITGATITGATVTGGVVQTANSGARVDIRSSAANTISFYTGTSSETPGQISANTSGASYLDITSPYGPGQAAAHIQLISGASPSAQIYCDVTMSQGATVGAALTVTGYLYANGGLTTAGLTSTSPIFTNSLSPRTGSVVTVSGGLVVQSDGINVTGNSTFNNFVNLNGSVSGFTSNGTVHVDDLYVDSHPSTANAANAYMNPSTGRLLYSTSTERHKENIRPAVIDVDQALALQESFYESNLEDDDPTQVFVGFIAEQAAELGLDHWVARDDDGQPIGFNYATWPVAQQAILRDQERRITAQQEQINDLTERLARLEQGA